MSAIKKLDHLFILEIGGSEKPQLVLSGEKDKTLVIIEDDPIQQEYLSKLSEEYFNKTLCFKSVEQAFLYLNNVDVNVDVVLIDYFLPGKKGTSIIGLMKKINNDARLYLMTGDLEKIDPEDSHISDLESYIQKPLSFNQIKNIFES